MDYVRRAGHRRGAALTTLAALCTAFALCTAQAATGANTQAPASEYEALPVCHAPMPGYASCLALALAPKTAAARARTHAPEVAQGTALVMAKSAEECAQIYPACLSPADLNGAYFPGEKPEATEAQTIALVDAYNDPEAEADLKVYDEAFGPDHALGVRRCEDGVL